MNKRIAKSGFSQTKDSDLLVIASTVITAMTGNAFFSNISPDLSDVIAARDDFSQKLEIATRKGSPLDFSLKNDSRLVLEGLLKRLAFYVNTEANGSLSIVLSSGFPISAARQKASPPIIPERIRLSDWRQSGQVRLDFDPIPDAWLYEYSYSRDVNPDGSVNWGEDFYSSPKALGNILAPLVPASLYYVRVRARNGQGESDWSTPVTIIAR